MDERVLATMIRDSGPLQTLTQKELRLDSMPVTIDPSPKPVRAWVRFGSTPALIDGEACRWTADAVAVRFMVSGTEYKAWVWSSAVTPRT